MHRSFPMHALTPIMRIAKESMHDRTATHRSTLAVASMTLSAPRMYVIWLDNGPPSLGHAVSVSHTGRWNRVARSFRYLQGPCKLCHQSQTCMAELNMTRCCVVLRQVPVPVQECWLLFNQSGHHCW